MVKANVSLPNVSLCFIYDRARRQVTEKSLFLYLEDGSLITAMRTPYLMNEIILHYCLQQRRCRLHFFFFCNTWTSSCTA